ncbi:DEAD/DEAH box helicase [bacterium]|nr:DEAD/DEAH box helicase [bacterium]PIU91326.1 MAG: helicase SNF2 [Anaerolineae bacterium CG06_land_8_20_14_3_00_57_67]PIW20546.1 MAG: helicase SNF2 [Anaerolineae bacterium CG17_big_fil_post_rev_8_21_14_2_50_57_27]PIX46890.1 MAG: helicase SNF2 [Anaerolineae bacterium CG_4_8_14_3_um_filter_59_70]
MTLISSKNISETDIRLLPVDKAALKGISAGQFASRDLYRLRLLAEHAQLISGFDELVCLESLEFAPFDYQVRAAQIMLRRFRGRGMFCDEVGLGKTIEAGLVLKEYLVRNVVQRVLIVTPAALVEQWREELAIKFGLPRFTTSADAEFRAAGAKAWERFPLLIASLATARRAEHRARIAQIPYDLVIVDEAHHLKNRNSASWKFVNDLQRKYILLLTATPVENDLDELYNLITLLKPGQLKTPREFRKQFVAHGDPRLPKNRGQLRDLLGDVMVRHTRSQVNIKLPPRQASTIRLGLSQEETDFYQAVSGYVRAQMRTSPFHLPIAAPPDSEITKTLPGSDEGTEGDKSLRQVDRFALLTLQREIGSSPQSAEPTLRALAERAHRAEQRRELLELADQSTRIQAWAKAEALEKLLLTSLRDPAEKIIIFTHFRRTLERLAERLRGLGLSVVTYHGEMGTPSKNQAIADFEQRAQVLLSTEAAGEGRNLQFCRTMVNFDIPWNPMRIEQRVGRIHRIGQTRDVRIYNLSARGTVEDYLLEILDQKLNMFELVIGEMDMILGQLSDERDFEDLLLDIWMQAESAEELHDGFKQLGEALVQARQAHQKTQEYDEALFGEDFSAE